MASVRGETCVRERCGVRAGAVRRVRVRRAASCGVLVRRGMQMRCGERVRSRVLVRSG